MSDGRFSSTRETEEERLARYERLLKQNEAEASRYRAEIKALKRRIYKKEMALRSCDTCIEPADRCVLAMTCRRDQVDRLRFWRQRPKEQS